MRIKHRGNRGMRNPAFGVVMLTPVVLAGAVAAAPGGNGTPVRDGEVTPLAAVETPRPDTTGTTVVAAARPPADFRFGANTLSPPPPAAVVNAAGGMRIPAMALSAYRKAEQTMSVAAPNCGVSWNLLAGIGRIESSHANGGATDARGTAVRPIYGPSLDGSLPGNEVIVQSNAGGRPVYARAMGPMQFLPGTWSRFASDGDGDGKADPQNLFDAALSTARYLCSGGLNLRNQAQVMTAILRYNNSMAYAQNVLGWAAAYATGVAPVDLPAITGPVPALGDTHLETNPQGLGPDLSDLAALHLSDPLAELTALGNSQVAGQMIPGPLPGPAEGVAPQHGCEVICMASQLAPPSAENVPPWMPPWMAPGGSAPWLGPSDPAAPPPWIAPPAGAPLPGPAGAGPAPGPVPPQAPAPAPGPAPAPDALAPAAPPWMPPAPGPEPAPAPGPAPLGGAAEAPAAPGPLPGPA